MNKRVLMLGVCALPALGLSCGIEPLERAASESTDPAEPSSTGFSPEAERIRTLNQDLSLGSTGDDVAAVHAYLTRYGYFPSEGLARVFPAWRPIVAEGPASPSVYDERTVEAVKNYQAVYRIPVTGIVDEKTREMMRTPRCGTPEGIRSSDPSDKFGIKGKYWGNTVYWKFTGTLWPSDPNMRIRVREAANAWEHQTSLDFTEITAGTYDMSVRFGTIQCLPLVPCFPDAWAVTSKPNPVAGTADITVNTSQRFYYGTGAVPQDGLTGDFYSIISHEIGHAIGLAHSSLDGDPYGGTVMWPGMASGATKRVLQVDDKVAISSMYDQWQQMDDATRDVGVGSNGEVWAVSSSDNAVWKLEGGTWYWTGANASRIAVGATGLPYVIAGWGDGTIWRRTSNWRLNSPPPGWIDPPAWVQLPGGGCARDIGVGPDPAGGDGVWAIGCDGAANGSTDGTIWKFTGSGWMHEQAGGLAAGISVGHDGRPWVRTAAGGVFRRSTSDPWTGVWEHVSSSPPATDIGVGPGNYPWIVNSNQISTVYVLNQQPQIGDGGEGGAPWRNEWRPVAATGRPYYIAVGPNGEPWFANSIGRLYKTIK